MRLELDSLEPYICPHCGGDYLHHSSVWTYFRFNEDSQAGICVSADSYSGETFLVEDMDDVNPSRRRDGMVVKFWCENCDNKPEYAIVQHKGQTFMGWLK